MAKEEILLPTNISDLRYVSAPATKVAKKIKEDFRSSMIEKLKSNPFIPLGMLATTGMIVMGLREFVRRNSKKQQFYMKGRVMFQFFTFFSFAAGGIYHSFTDPKVKEEEVDYSKY